MGGWSVGFCGLKAPSEGAETLPWSPAPPRAGPAPYLARAVELLGYAPEVSLPGQRVQLILHVVHKLLQRHELVGPVELPPGRQRGDDFLTQVRHRRAHLERAGQGRSTGGPGRSLGEAQGEGMALF